ncbi:MAG: tRNA uridine-5-carboxymethylaminomethyl(34) synthesis GTPase MnmE [Clostridia bacterium]|nr:tRNA uridine-5-carboxymethylaminomethyl(34) synthesis GTPase MnmE [Clostridia bacterium]
MNDCISAVATAPGTGGVAIVRLSGDNALQIASKMFKPLSKINVLDFEPYKLYVGEILGEDFTDNGMCVYFKAPKSFTGEDVVELHCHGGIAITRGILNKTFKLGARLATNGEFTKRAFMNGKLSLSSCEGLIDMINSESVTQIKSGFYLFKEGLKNKIIAIQNALTDILAQIDANIDYPEEGLIDENGKEIKQKLLKIKPELKNLIDSYNSGKIIKNGVSVALVGKTNTGKSSLLNALVGEDKAIVTSVAGTTRDVVEASLFIKGIKFNLFDTAGIRETEDLVEQIGIQRSNNLIERADLILFVTDNCNFDDQDKELYAKVKDKNLITVYNKNDLNNIEVFDKNCVSISCKTGKNIDKLLDLLFSLGAKNVNTDGEYITQHRHHRALLDAFKNLDTAIMNIDFMPLDLVTVDIKECWQKLGEITGTTASEEIVNEIFARFCVGK